jgi:hypothetical protein
MHLSTYCQLDRPTAKLVTPRWTDYMVLAKWNGEWKIVSVLLRELLNRQSGR